MTTTALFARFLLLTAILPPSLALASSINLGVVSFNTLIPSAGSSPGVNDFEIDNFTGASDLPSDFPVSGPLTFNNSVLVLTLQGGTQETILLGNLAPGVYTPTTLQFPTLTVFTSALFTATLNSSGVPLFDGSSLHASSMAISVDLLPSSGATLAQDTDFALITVTTVTAPEPNPAVFEVAALMAVLRYGRRFRRSE